MGVIVESRVQKVPSQERPVHYVYFQLSNQKLLRSFWHCTGHLLSAFCMLLQFQFSLGKAWGHVSLPGVILKAPPPYLCHLDTGHSLCFQVMELDSLWLSPEQLCKMIPSVALGYQIPYATALACWWPSGRLAMRTETGINSTRRQFPRIPTEHAPRAPFLSSLCSTVLLSGIAAIVRKNSLPFLRYWRGSILAGSNIGYEAQVTDFRGKSVLDTQSPWMFFFICVLQSKVFMLSGSLM